MGRALRPKTFAKDCALQFMDGTHTEKEGGRERPGTTTLGVGVGVEPAVVVVTPGGRGAVLVAMVGVWLELLEEAVVVVSGWGWLAMVAGGWG